ncbi:(2Fe-2S)-binding protein [Megalodesulfovibrio gigas]|nr:(2Fe-2S)-binding protein [Megalodesulfovibrio gigas]
MSSSPKSPPPQAGMTRRGFLKSMSVSAVATTMATTMATGAATLATATRAAAQDDAPPPVLRGLSPLSLTVNGVARTVLAEPRWTLLHVLRECLGITSPKPGCERGECGSCTVLVDGVARYACLMLAFEAQGRNIETVEGLMDGERLGPVQQAFLEEDALQCGYCTPGQIMAAEALLRQQPDPTLEEIRVGMSGNLCRCGAYRHILTAVAAASVKKKS